MPRSPVHSLCRALICFPRQLQARLEWKEAQRSLERGYIHHWRTLSLGTVLYPPWGLWWIFKDVKDINPLAGAAIVCPRGLEVSACLPKCSISFLGAAEVPQRDEANKPLPLFICHFSLAQVLQDSFPTGSQSQHMSLCCTLRWYIVLHWGWIKCTITAYFLERRFDNDKCLDILTYSDSLIPCPSSCSEFALKNPFSCKKEYPGHWMCIYWPGFKCHIHQFCTMWAWETVLILLAHLVFSSVKG